MTRVKLKRRSFLKAVLGGIAAATLPLSPPEEPWRNPVYTPEIWGGNIELLTGSRIVSFEIQSHYYLQWEDGRWKEIPCPEFGGSSTT